MTSCRDMLQSEQMKTCYRARVRVRSIRDISCILFCILKYTSFSESRMSSKLQAQTSR